MDLPLLIVPRGGVPVVRLMHLAPQAFTPFETAWAFSAKLAAANALCAAQVAAVLGVPDAGSAQLLPPGVPRAARALGARLGIGPRRLEHAFFTGGMMRLRPLICVDLRVCPVCARAGYHFLVHQLRPIVRCPVHDAPLRDRCRRCGAQIGYALGDSMVAGPINCAACGAALLATTMGGQAKAARLSEPAILRIERWIVYLLGREPPARRSEGRALTSTHVACRRGAGDETDWDRVATQAVHGQLPRRRLSARHWPAFGDSYQLLETIYWRQANRDWQRLSSPSRRWYRCLVGRRPHGEAPDERVLVFIYWRMTWQGCSDPRRLGRSGAMPFFGVAAWQAAQPDAAADVDIDDEIEAFVAALEESRRDWQESVRLMALKDLEARAWQLRLAPQMLAGGLRVDRSSRA